ncbi:hypothetical protein AVEN_61592-1 [Araneus ventricosus]|uniref:Uncharacterized protein n=1 Tax=Araneus ventricosus TaxID=182803 RepID=A0A4Y2NLP8_ARAVE|nr:hypothetical protein AVEN_61592-1 [Araneus ventricosus]
MPFITFSIAKGENFGSSLFGMEIIRNRTCSASVSMLKAEFKRVSKVSIQGNKIFGTRLHSSPWNPISEGNYRIWEFPASASTLVLAGTYMLRATSRNVDHP